jgi:hypothetical protein
MHWNAKAGNRCWHGSVKTASSRALPVARIPAGSDNMFLASALDCANRCSAGLEQSWPVIRVIPVVATDLFSCTERTLAALAMGFESFGGLLALASRKVGDNGELKIARSYVICVSAGSDGMRSPTLTRHCRVEFVVILQLGNHAELRDVNACTASRSSPTDGRCSHYTVRIVW